MSTTKNGRVSDNETHWRKLQDGCLADMMAVKKEQVRLRPKTDNQAEYFDAIRNSCLTICLGPAGTGKTFIACGIAAEMLKDRKIEKVVVARPLLSCDEEMGFLPGGVEEKVGPFMTPMVEAFGEFLPPRELQEFSERGAIEVCPLATMRGRTFKKAMVILDEAQNVTRRQMKMFLTRMGEGSKMVVCGDTTQSDLPSGRSNALQELPGRLGNDKDVYVVYLTEDDIVRSDLVGRVVRKLSDW